MLRGGALACREGGGLVCRRVCELECATQLEVHGVLQAAVVLN